MNNRDYKHFAPNTFWHIFNRGNGKQDIFLDAEDYKYFLLRLKEYLFPVLPLKMPIQDLLDGHLQGGSAMVAESHTPYIRKTLPQNCYTMLSYCLMPNHFHFEIRQDKNIQLGKLLAKLCTSYSKYFNKKYNRVGHIFQDQFKAVLITSDEQLLWLSAYIHNNPKTAGLVKDLQDYPWSSYLDYIGVRNGTLCNQSLLLGMMGRDCKVYKNFVVNSFEKIKECKNLDHLLLD